MESEKAFSAYSFPIFLLNEEDIEAQKSGDPGFNRHIGGCYQSGSPMPLNE
jgi:hypothetical protein